jgi:hypothetical protein
VRYLQYPDAEILVLNYNLMGEAESMALFTPPLTYVYLIQNVDYNASGQITKIRYGNGVVTDYFYNEQTLRLRDLQTLAPAGATLQQYHYEGAR